MLFPNVFGEEDYDTVDERSAPSRDSSRYELATSTPLTTPPISPRWKKKDGVQGKQAGPNIFVRLMRTLKLENDLGTELGKYLKVNPKRTWLGGKILLVYSERKLVIFCLIHLVLTMVVWFHFFYGTFSTKTVLFGLKRAGTYVPGGFF